MRRPSRRSVLFGGAATALAAPFARLLAPKNASAFSPGERAERLIIFYAPDGVPGLSSNGEASLWHPSGSGSNVSLPAVLTSLQPFVDDCTFFRNLSLGPADQGSHPGGAKKLLTATDGGGGISIDRHLANTVGSDRPFRHIYLGAQANINNASGDKHISYVAPGQTAAPEDDPRRAFSNLFDSSPVLGGSRATDTESVLDAAIEELNELRGRLGSVDKVKLDLHLEALREIEQRTGGGPGGPGNPGGPSCDAPTLDSGGVTDQNLYQPEMFPAILRAQTDVMVQAMACELSRVGVLQASHHTSELIMSRFAGTDMHDPNFDMRSHQASHYGASHDFGHREFADFVKQRRWWIEQYAYLLESLRERPERDGTMLDYSLVLFCTEVTDGNTHGHDDIPMILAGRGAGRINSGRVIDNGYRRHADLLVAIAQAMGDSIDQFGQGSSGPLPGLLS